MPKSRSKAIVLPSFEIDGQRTRPSLNVVSGFAGLKSCAAFDPVLETLQMFCAPLRSDMKYSVLPSPLHIGQASFAPPLVTCWYEGVASSFAAFFTSQSSLSSRWLCPLRHHCD